MIKLKNLFRKEKSRKPNSKDILNKMNLTESDKREMDKIAEEVLKGFKSIR